MNITMEKSDCSKAIDTVLDSIIYDDGHNAEHCVLLATRLLADSEMTPLKYDIISKMAKIMSIADISSPESIKPTKKNKLFEYSVSEKHLPKGETLENIASLLEAVMDLNMGFIIAERDNVSDVTIIRKDLYVTYFHITRHHPFKVKDKIVFGLTVDHDKLYDSHGMRRLTYAISEN